MKSWIIIRIRVEHLFFFLWSVRIVYITVQREWDWLWLLFIKTELVELKISMHGKGVTCSCHLIATYPVLWTWSGFKWIRWLPLVEKAYRSLLFGTAFEGVILWQVCMVFFLCAFFLFFFFFCCFCFVLLCYLVRRLLSFLSSCMRYRWRISSSREKFCYMNLNCNGL